MSFIYYLGTRTAKSAWLEVQYTSSVVFYLDVTYMYMYCPCQMRQFKKKVKNNRQSFPSFFKQRFVNLLFFFIIDDSTWSVFRFWTVGWTKEEILKTSLWALGHFDEQISQLFEILYEKQMADLMIRAVYYEVGRKSKRKCHIGSAARDIALWVIQLPNRGGSWALNHMMS